MVVGLGQGSLAFQPARGATTRMIDGEVLCSRREEAGDAGRSPSAAAPPAEGGSSGGDYGAENRSGSPAAHNQHGQWDRVGQTRLQGTA